jgi:hypothetical protein
MTMHLSGQDIPLAQMGPDFVILKAALITGQPPQDVTLTLVVDEDSKTFPMHLPQGIPAGQRRVALVDVEEAALVEG